MKKSPVLRPYASSDRTGRTRTILLVKRTDWYGFPPSEQSKNITVISDKMLTDLSGRAGRVFGSKAGLTNRTQRGSRVLTERYANFYSVMSRENSKVTITIFSIANNVTA